jgi:hypothetical protein
MLTRTVAYHAVRVNVKYYFTSPISRPYVQVELILAGVFLFAPQSQHGIRT